jgi:hypothetical protein
MFDVRIPGSVMKEEVVASSLKSSGKNCRNLNESFISLTEEQGSNMVLLKKAQQDFAHI